jgi:NitT/TauT family transport system ATP-binding protein
MQQRVALARALACAPRLLLMDEPFASLDAGTREDLEDELLRIWRDLGLSIIFVTHDLDEALYVSERVVLMSRLPGRVRAEHIVPFSYPRDQMQTRASKDFVEMRRQLYAALRNSGGGDTSGAPS